MIIRSQQQQHNNNNNNIQQNSGSCSPVPGSIPQPSILSNEESDLYLLNNSYEYRGDSRYNNHTTSTSSPHPYSLYSTHENHASEGRNQFSSPYENNASPYMHSTASRKQSIGIETKDEDKRSIDFPSSPPPESSSTTIKYGNTSSPPSWSDFTANNTTSVNRKSSLGMKFNTKHTYITFTCVYLLSLTYRVFFNYSHSWSCDGSWMSPLVKRNRR